MPTSTDTVRITIPSVPDGCAARSWRKTITRLDPSGRGGEQIAGVWLDARAVFMLASGTLVLTADLTETGHAESRYSGTYTTYSYTLSVSVVDQSADGGLKHLWTRSYATRNGAFGTATSNKITKLLATFPPPRTGIAPLELIAAPLERTTRDDSCTGCKKALAAGDGVLRRGSDGKRRGYHEDCTDHENRATRAADGRRAAERAAESARRATEPRRNQFAEACAKCSQTVPAGEGLLRQAYGRWTVAHEAPCPASPRAGSGLTFMIRAAVPGRRGNAGSYWKTGQVLRAETSQTVPDDAPGHRPGRHPGRTSLIAVVVSERTPEYCRDQDGDQPTELIGEDGWLYTAVARPATADEAAELLAREADQQAAAALDAEREQLLNAWHPGADGVVPESVDLSNAVQVPTGAENYVVGGGLVHVDRLYVDDGAAVAYAMRYNGMDGDTWDRSNAYPAGQYIAIAYPLTPQRADVIARLRDRYATTENRN